VSGVVAAPVVGHAEAQGSDLGDNGDAGRRCWAYLAVFWSASRQQKYTAASASCPKCRERSRPAGSALRHGRATCAECGRCGRPARRPCIV
jgi:hypothetical protein